MQKAPNYTRLQTPEGRLVDVVSWKVADKLAEGWVPCSLPDRRGVLHASTPGRHKGRPAFILASGPSARIAPAADLRGACDRIGAVCWGVNDLWRVCGGHPFPRADYWVILDDIYWTTHRKAIAAYMIDNPGVLPCLWTVPGEAVDYQRLPISLARVAEPGLPYVANEYFHGESSGCAAVQMAMHSGCDPIYLLGHDLRASGNKTHGFGVRSGGELSGNYPQGETMLAGYRLLAEHARSLGVRIVNLSPDSAVDFVDREDLGAFIRG